MTQQDGTVRPFGNVYWDNHEPGRYVDVVSAGPLLASVDKYNRGLRYCINSESWWFIHLDDGERRVQRLPHSVHE